VQADDFDSGARREAAPDLACVVHGNAELVGFQSGGDVRMTAGVDIRIHPERHTRPGLPLASERLDPFELAG
jgi:hypothetical protein